MNSFLYCLLVKRPPAPPLSCVSSYWRLRSCSYAIVNINKTSVRLLFVLFLFSAHTCGLEVDLKRHSYPSFRNVAKLYTSVYIYSVFAEGIIIFMWYKAHL